MFAESDDVGQSVRDGEAMRRTDSTQPWAALVTMPARNKTASRPTSELLALSPEAMALGLTPEIDEEGHIEHKLRLLSPSPDRFNKLVTQLKWRLLEGSNRALYQLGVRDDGAIVGLPQHELTESLETLARMAEVLDATISILRKIEVDTSVRIPDLDPPGSARRLRRPSRKAVTLSMGYRDLSPATPPELNPDDRIRTSGELEDEDDDLLDVFPSIDVFRYASTADAVVNPTAITRRMSAEDRWAKKLAKRTKSDVRRELGVVVESNEVIRTNSTSSFTISAGGRRIHAGPEPRFVCEVEIFASTPTPDLDSFDFDLTL